MAKQTHPWEDNWDLGDRFKVGGQGFTYLATRKVSPSEQVALKILKNNKSEQARGRMHREVASLEVLSSAGGAVPSVLEHNTQHYLEKSVELFVVMEYISGRTLREVIESDGPTPLNLATPVMLKICDTIELAHTFPILHRDLKPENIIARDIKSADIVIVDYGLSFNGENPDVTVTDDTFRNRFLDLPETNTPGGNRRDPRSDVTAACAIYYYLLTGQVPGQLQDGDGRLPHLRPGYSLKESLGQIPQLGQLEAFFNRGFAPSVDNRFQTISELRDRLKLVMGGSAELELEDPIKVAERISVLLRQRDRKTQINEFKAPAHKYLESILKYVNSFNEKLGRFLLDIRYDQSLGGVLPSSYDRVSPSQLKIQMNPAHHNHLRIAVYTVASRGEQCVILRQKYAREGSENQISPTSDYEEIVWYDSPTPPDWQPIKSDIDAWLNNSMNELKDLVLG